MLKSKQKNEKKNNKEKEEKRNKERTSMSNTQTTYNNIRPEIQSIFNSAKENIKLLCEVPAENIPERMVNKLKILTVFQKQLEHQYNNINDT